MNILHGVIFNNCRAKKPPPDVGAQLRQDTRTRRRRPATSRMAGPEGPAPGALGGDHRGDAAQDRDQAPGEAGAAGPR